MRITNTMTTNRLLLNLNRNATMVDRLIMQLTSGKRIQNPSDDPIIATRALRFRTNVAEVQQFQRNADKATSWMEVSEQALRNVTDIMERINELLVQGATGTYTFQNRQTISREIQMLFEQMNQELNQTFAGRHVFSGFRTDQPPVLTLNNPDGFFSISKTLQQRDMEVNTMRTWRDGNGTLHRIPELPANAPTGYHPQGLNIMKLPYRNVGNVTIPGITVNTVSINSATTNPYIPSPGTINFIPETGELVFSDGALAQFDNISASPITMGQTMPTRPTPPNPDDFHASGDLNPAFVAHWAQFEALMAPGGAFTLAHNAAMLQLAEFETAYGQFLIDMQDYENGIRFSPPIPPTPPTIPTAPIPPDPHGRTDFAAFYAAYNIYIASFGTAQSAGAYTTYLADHATWNTNVNNWLADPINAGATLEDAIAIYPVPIAPIVPLTGTGSWPAPQILNPPVPYSPPHSNLDLAFMAEFNAFMSSFSHYTQDMTKQHTIRDQLWNLDRATTGQRGINIQYTVQGAFAGELNPLVFFDTVDFGRLDHEGNYLHFLQENQNMRFELGASTRVTVNTQANNAYPWQLFADMRTFVDLVNRIEIGEGADAAQREAEQVIFREGLYQKFTNMMSMLERHVQVTATEYTALGSRMDRVELISRRLDENEDTFMNLMSQNENVDYIEALMRFNAAEAVLQAAMQVGARIAQISLVNFI